jgi:hypothetical protein
MRQRHVAAERLNARETLRACGIDVGADFHALSAQQVDALLAAADRVKYQRPPNANGSRARYFHDRLQRRARAK